MAGVKKLYYKCPHCLNLFPDIASAKSHKCEAKSSATTTQSNMSLLPRQGQTKQAATSSTTTTQSNMLEKDQTAKSSVTTTHSNMPLVPQQGQTVQAGPVMNIPQNDNQTQEAGEHVVWQYPDTLLLISQYKALESKIKKKNLWSKITEGMQTNGYSYTPDQCEGRWKTLVRGVKRVADHNAKTGNAPKKHPFEDELEFYSERPNVKPTYLVSSTSTIENLDESHEEDSEEEGRSKSPVPVPAKKKRSNISDVLDVLKVHMQAQSERHQETLQRQEQMHEERLAVMKGFLDVFKDMKK